MVQIAITSTFVVAAIALNIVPAMAAPIASSNLESRTLGRFTGKVGTNIAEGLAQDQIKKKFADFTRTPGTPVPAAFAGLVGKPTPFIPGNPVVPPSGAGNPAKIFGSSPVPKPNPTLFNAIGRKKKTRALGDDSDVNGTSGTDDSSESDLSDVEENSSIKARQLGRFPGKVATTFAEGLAQDQIKKKFADFTRTPTMPVPAPLAGIIGKPSPFVPNNPLIPPAGAGNPAKIFGSAPAPKPNPTLFNSIIRKKKTRALDHNSDDEGSDADDESDLSDIEENSGLRARQLGRLPGKVATTFAEGLAQDQIKKKFADFTRTPTTPIPAPLAGIIGKPSPFVPGNPVIPPAGAGNPAKIFGSTPAPKPNPTLFNAISRKKKTRALDDDSDVNGTSGTDNSFSESDQSDVEDNSGIEARQLGRFPGKVATTFAEGLAQDQIKKKFADFTRTPTTPIPAPLAGVIGKPIANPPAFPASGIAAAAKASSGGFNPAIASAATKPNPALFDALIKKKAGGKRDLQELHARFLEFLAERELDDLE